MHSRIVQRLILALLCLAALSQARAASTYSAIYVFGDSYSDVGNISLATNGAIPGPLYYNGRFSNGPIWVEHIAGFYGLPLLPSIAGGTDYAVGGAKVLAPVVEPGGTILSVPEQVGLYLIERGGKADPNALYILSGGGNDILAATGGSPDRLGLEMAAALATSVRNLHFAGARHIYLSGIPDVSLLPAAQPIAAFAHQVAVAGNAALKDLILPEQRLFGSHIIFANALAVPEQFKNDPTHSDFNNIITPCLDASTNTICADPDHTLFWDAEHPTAFGHSILAASAEALLTQ